MEAGGSVRRHVARQVPKGACWGLMTGCINSRSVIKNGQERQARGVMDSDAFILPDYTSSSPARSHQVHTSGTKRARTPLGPVCFLLFVCGEASAGPVGPVSSGFFIPLFLFGGVVQ